MTDSIPVQTGWLVKEPPTMFGKAKRRWFVLTQGKCAYFVDESLQNERGFFLVSEIRHAEPISQNGTKFQVVTDARNWKLEADTNEIMCNWVRSFNEQAAPATDMISVSDIDIEGRKPEEFRGLSVWLELPGLQPFVNAVNEKLNKQPHRAHIALLYGIDEDNAIEIFNTLSNKVALCYDEEWMQLLIKKTTIEVNVSQSMQVAFVDLYFQLSKELSELYQMTSDTFYSNQTLRSIVRPRCCIAYGELSLPEFQEGFYNFEQHVASHQTEPVYKFGNLSLWRTHGPPEQWQELASHPILQS